MQFLYSTVSGNQTPLIPFSHFFFTDVQFSEKKQQTKVTVIRNHVSSI